MTPHGLETRRLATPEDTEAFGRELAAGLRAGDLVILDGRLGAGKTVLARGIAAGLGARGQVASPTYVIARVHQAGERPGSWEAGAGGAEHAGAGAAGVAMIHVDAYRLGDGPEALDQLDALDLDTDLEDAVVVVEWGAGLAERLAEEHVLVRLARDPDTDVRTAEWGRVGV